MDTVTRRPIAGIMLVMVDAEHHLPVTAASRISLPRERIEAFCVAHGIRRLALFGSVLRDDFREASDVDVLVEFRPGVRVGLALVRMEDELSAILGRKADLNTPGSLSKHFREEVFREAEVVYVAA